MSKKKDRAAVEVEKAPPSRFDWLEFTTSYSYWREINANLLSYVDILEKEVKKLSEVLPDSESYWTMNSKLDDAKSVAKAVDEGMYPHIVEREQL